MIAIPIQPETMALITKLNGVRPEIEMWAKSLYLYYGEDREAVIVSQARFMSRLFGPEPTKITLLHFED